MPSHDKVNSASVYFNENWYRYQSTIKNNTLYHREMMTALGQFLTKTMGSRAFSFVDMGCGDSSTIATVLANSSIETYIGIDEAHDVLKMAAISLAPLKAKKTFIADNMTSAILHIQNPVDIIFTSYAAHHLSLQDKFNFIENCKQHLKPQGFLLMIDGILKPHQTRDEWLDALQKRMESTLLDVSKEDIEARMEHPRKDDFPESIETFAHIAEQQSWRFFERIVDKGIFAFMVFAK